MAKTREQYINENIDNEAVSFNLVDQHTVERLRRDGIIQVPKKKVDIPKDMQWNQKFIASQMLKGIEHGDNVDQMASSIFLEIFSREDTFNLTEKGASDLIKRCKNSSIRNARTMVTSAENNGRLDSYKDLAAKGVVQKKEWVATPDDRTRPTHVDIDGEEQDIDKVFSNGCMFPGDGKGPAEEVWMCRCTMTDHIIGFRRADGSISKVNYAPDRTLHEQQMEDAKERRGMKEEKETIFNDEKLVYDRDSFDKEAERQGLDLTAYDIDDYVESSYGAKQLGDKISKFIDNAPEEMKIGDETLYRGLYFNSEKEMKDFLDQNVIQSRRDGLSWTTDKEVADAFSKEASDYSVTLINEDDAKNAISIKNISDTPSSSSEVLYSSSTDFEIIDIEFDGNHATVYVTEAAVSKKKY